MKKTLLFSALFTILAQTSTVSMAHANAGDVAVKASKLRFFKAFLDWRFYAVVGPGVWLWSGVGAPPASIGLCALEAKTVGRAKVLKDPGFCRLYYGDPMLNSCKVANNAVALMFPVDETGENAIRFVGSFDAANRLTKVTQAFVKINLESPKKEFQVLSFPLTAEIDEKGLTKTVAITPSEVTARGDKEDEDHMFKHFDEVASVMAMAFNECSDGKYDAMMKKIMSTQPSSRQTGTKK